MAIGPFIAYLISLNQGMHVDEARTIGFMTIAMVHLLQVFNVRRENGLGYDQTFLQNKYLMGAILLTLALQLSAIYIPGLQQILRTRALSPSMWIYVLIGMMIPNVVLQIIAIIKQTRKGES